MWLDEQDKRMMTGREGEGIYAFPDLTEGRRFPATNFFDMEIFFLVTA